MAATVEFRRAPSIPNKHSAHSVQSCPACGTDVKADTAEVALARRRVAELESQMELLKEKATAAVDRCTDYEDQLRSFQASHERAKLPRSNTSDSLDPFRRSDEEPRPATAGAGSTKHSRFSFLTSLRPSTSSLTPPPPSTSSPSDMELLNELERERILRAKAEQRVQMVDLEIEELSVQLFSQANEMVATERRARAKLEERIELLERKDQDKMARLERLEKAVTRLDRVKAILEQPEHGRDGLPVGSAMLAPPARR